MPNWYTGSKTYIIDSLLLLDGINQQQQMATLQSNLPIVYRLLRDEWSPEIGLRISQTVLKLLFQSSSEQVIMFVTQLLLNLLLTRLEDHIAQLIQLNPEYLCVERLFHLSQTPTPARMLLLSYIACKIDSLRVQLFNKISEQGANCGRLLLHGMFSSPILSDKMYVEFCRLYCGAFTTDQRYFSIFLREIAIAPSQLNFSVLFEQSHELTDFIITQKINVVELSPLMSQLPRGRGENTFKQIAAIFEAQQQDSSHLRQLHQSLSKNFPILTDKANISAIERIARIPQFQALNFYVSYDQSLFLGQIRAKCVVIFVSKRILLAHSASFCARLLRALNPRAFCDLPADQIRDIQYIQQLYEVENGPVYATEEIQARVSAIRGLSLRGEEK